MEQLIIFAGPFRLTPKTKTLMNFWGRFSATLGMSRGQLRPTAGY